MVNPLRSSGMDLTTIGTKVWSFLLPDSGEHQFMVKQVGTPDQTMSIDGGPDINQQGKLFTGPENSVLELQFTGPGSYKHSKHWYLIVNGMCVESYAVDKRRSGDESLRELKGKPDGSYVISTEFNAAGLELDIVSTFSFRCGEPVHEIHIAQAKTVWHTVYDGRIMTRAQIADGVHVTFEVEVESGQRLSVVACGQWLDLPRTRGKWGYSVFVNGINVPASWTKMTNETCPKMAPTLIPVAVVPPMPTEDLSDESLDGKVRVDAQAVERECLPQGVCFDATSGMYQANIRAKSGKFVSLGEFRSPDEAHQRYVEAVPLHYPDKLLPLVPPSF